MEIKKWIMATVALIIITLGSITLLIDSNEFSVVLKDGSVKAKYYEGVLKVYDGKYLAFGDSISLYYWNGKGYSTMYKVQGDKYSNLSYSKEGNTTFIQQTIYYTKGNLTRNFEITEYKIKESFEWNPTEINLKVYFLWNYDELNKLDKKEVYVDQYNNQTKAVMDFSIVNNWERELNNIVRVERLTSGKLSIRTKVFTGNISFDPELILRKYLYHDEVIAENIQETCWIDGNNKECNAVIYSFPKWIKVKEEFKNFTNVVKLTQNNITGNYILNYSNNWSIEIAIRVKDLLGNSKDIKNLDKVADILWELKDNIDSFEWGPMVRNIDKDKAKLDSVSFEIVNYTGIEEKDIIFDNFCWYIKNVKTCFYDTLEKNYTLESKNKIFSIKNIANKTELLLDPTSETFGQGIALDSYMKRYNANCDTNYGTATSILFMAASSTCSSSPTYYQTRAIVSFNLSTIEGIQGVTSAYFWGKTGAVGRAGAVSTSYVNTQNLAPINETTITWNNQPCGVATSMNASCTGTGASNSLTSGSTWYSWNVTNGASYIVSNFAANAKILTLVFSGGPTDIFPTSVFTKEYATAADRLYLNITYNLNSAPTAVAAVISPASPYSYNNLLGNANSTDPDSVTTISTYYTWFKNNVTNLTGIYTPITNNTNTQITTVLSGNLTINDEWILGIICSDASLNSSALNSSKVIIQAITPLIISNVNDNSSATYPGKEQYVKHEAYLEDNSTLAGYIFSWNDSGSWANDSFVALTGTTNWSNITKQVTSNKNSVIGWQIYVNDSGNEWNSTGVQTYTVTDNYISDCTTLTTNNVTYKLNQSLMNKDPPDYEGCINIEATNITLDCQGYTIDGQDEALNFGIYMYQDVETQTNTTIKNCTISDWSYGLQTYNSGNISLLDSNFNSNGYALYYSASGDNNFITNCNIINASEGAIVITTSSLTITNIIIDCGSTDDRAIDVSSGNPSTFENINITNCNDGFLVYTDENTFSNIIVNNSVYGVDVRGDYNRFYNFSVKNQAVYGVGISIDSGGGAADHNYFESLNISNVSYCVAIKGNNNTIINSWFENCSESGSIGVDGTNHTIYNNYFDTVNTLSISATQTNWNTTSQIGTRIYGLGSLIGGNFWGTYSNGCADSNQDSFCDLPYNISTNTSCTYGVDCGDNVDYLPLSLIATWNFSVWTGTTWVNASTNLNYPNFRLCPEGISPGEKCNDTYVAPDYQTEIQPIYRINNTGGGYTTILMKLNTTITGIDYICNVDDFSHSGEKILNTTWQSFGSGIDHCGYGWCWVNATNFEPPAEAVEVQVQLTY